MSDLGTTDSTFLFADIAGYTALTAAHGDERAAELAAEFCAVVADAMADRGELVKTIGDAVMLRLDDPRDAVRLGLRIPYELWTGDGLPAAAVGMHHGPAVERQGDWFGSTVNVAARLAALAAGGEVVVSDVVKQAVGELPGVNFEAQGHRTLRNLPGRVTIFKAHPEGQPPLPSEVDPVCRMLVSAGQQQASLEHEGVRYRFCSSECAERFKATPQDYLDHI
ncbi:MAG TPA: adenylate/guanylate cyclase domain-containing protein [Gemmatimonadales bacterium]|nr:adenylate/guanylate cyclase domain-containing protein [Gemmatimonadales bacterium]